MKKEAVFVIIAVLVVAGIFLYKAHSVGMVIDEKTYCNKRCEAGEVCIKFNSYDDCIDEKDLIPEQEICEARNLSQENSNQCLECLSFNGNKFYRDGEVWHCQVLRGQCEKLGGDCVKQDWLDEKEINDKRRYIYRGNLGKINDYLCQNPETTCFILDQTIESISDEELFFSTSATPENIEQVYSYYSDKEDDVYNDYYNNYKIFYDFLIRLDTEKTIWTNVNGKSIKISGAVGGPLNYFFQIPDYSFEKENISDTKLFIGSVNSIEGYLPLDVVEGEIYYPDEKQNSCFIMIKSGIPESDVSTNILFKEEIDSIGFTGSVPVIIQYWCGSLKVNSCQYGIKKGNLKMDHQIKETQEISIFPEYEWIIKPNEKDFEECMEKLFGDPEINEPKKLSEKENPDEGVPIPNEEASSNEETPNLEGAAPPEETGSTDKESSDSGETSSPESSGGSSGSEEQ